MRDKGEIGRRALRSARELAHLATSLASEAANLTRTLETFGATQASVAASQASIHAAQNAFSIDASVLAPGDSPDLDEVLLKTGACLEAAEEAIRAARCALDAATTGMRGDVGSGDANS